MNLSEAITAVEQSQTVFQNADSQTVNDMAAASAIMTKLAAANAQIQADQSAQSVAAAALNDSLDALIAAAQGAKVVTLTDPMPVVMPPVTNVPPTIQGQ